MDNDLKTTLIAVVGGILALISKFLIPISQATADTITVLIVTVTLMILGYFTNKKVTPPSA